MVKMNFLGVIDGLITVTKYNTKLTPNDLAIRDLNEVAYCYLLHSMADDICFQLVDTATTEDLPHGDESLVCQNLLSRFQFRQFESVLELKENSI